MTRSGCSFFVVVNWTLLQVLCGFTCVGGLEMFVRREEEAEMFGLAGEGWERSFHRAKKTIITWVGPIVGPDGVTRRSTPLTTYCY